LGKTGFVDSGYRRAAFEVSRIPTAVAKRTNNKLRIGVEQKLNFMPALRPPPVHNSNGDQGHTADSAGQRT
jgi:hypothetical protein